MTRQVQEHPSVKVLCVGVSGTGKTTLFMKLIARVRAKWVFIFDTKEGDMSQRWGVRACVTADDLMDAIERGDRTIIFDPRELYAGNIEEGFMVFCKLVWEVGKLLDGVKLVIADELDSICSERVKPSELCKILSQGRTFQFDCYFMATAINAIHNQVRKEIQEVFAFRQGDANAVEWLAKKGFNRNELENLKNGLWHYKNLNTGETKKGGTAFEPKGATRDLRGL